MIYLDTHVVVWLYAQGRAALPPFAAERIGDEPDLRISPMVRLELQYLYEIERVTVPALPVIDALQSATGLTLCRGGFPAVAHEAESQSWTRDPFDRLIVAQAALHDALLLTKDAVIQRHYPNAAWDTAPSGRLL